MKDNEYMLDLSVKVININPSEHHEVLDKCKALKENGQFIDMIRDYQEQGVEEPYKCAIEECLKRGILSDYLSKKGSEVVNMLIAEYDYDMDIKVQREEAFEEGKLQGREEGEKSGIAKGERLGLAKIVMNMYRNGFTIEQIVAVTDKTAVEVKTVIDENQELNVL